MQGGEMMVPFKTHSKTLPSTTYNLKTKQKQQQTLRKRISNSEHR